MTQRRSWVTVLVGLFLLSGSGCTVQQQQQVMGTIGALIPGSSTSIITPRSSPTTTETQTAGTTTETQTTSAPAPRVDSERVDAQWVLRTLQRAMTDDPAPFQECLDNSPCKIALTAHLIRLQKQAGSTLELPPVYDRYDLKRGN